MTEPANWTSKPSKPDTTLAALEALLYHVELMERFSGWSVGEPVKARARAAIAKEKEHEALERTADLD